MTLVKLEPREENSDIVKRVLSNLTDPIIARAQRTNRLHKDSSFVQKLSVIEQMPSFYLG